ncbi:hypothetical protein [Anaerocolumna xylanovorans]|uniref:Ig-like domain (Group 2) n=1 Tax=Anaerocolumna xylanovorans DSM 12503 TaxID=1121345 RepID=A0A1M7YLE8_9FIRM|nr:hypothetical protein [Anaerocolumna xylanovorans]SHO53409.1 hypothetical protein SAMN02745217_04111 [Anaerocolumna xylanovorans DSM 12503]
MRKMLKFLGVLLLVLTECLPLNTDKAYAYTLENLESYIVNPEWFDNQEGRAGDNTGTGKTDCSYPQINSDVIYFDKTHKSYQLLLRQYDKEKGIDFENDDFEWEVIDERICTVDSDGFVKAGDMTGATTVIAENQNYALVIVVINLTGKYDSWYENMFVNNWFYGGLYNIKEEELSRSLGSALKGIVDAYVQHGDELYTNPEIRIEIVREAVRIINGKGYHPARIFDLFLDGIRTQKCAHVIGATVENGVVLDSPTLLLLDGKIYELNILGGFYEIATEKDGYWKNGYFYYTYLHHGLTGTDEWKVKFSTTKEYNYNNEHDYMINKLHGIKID